MGHRPGLFSAAAAATRMLTRTEDHTPRYLSDESPIHVRKVSEKVYHKHKTIFITAQSTRHMHYIMTCLEW